jgi:pyrroline-5-carboxylate reductase
VKTQKAPLAKATDVGNTPQAKTDEKVGFIGGTGNMGSAIIRGLIETQTISPSNILSTGRDQKKLERFAVETGCTVVPDLTALCAEASTLFLCVKPAQCASVLEDLAARTGELLETKRIISVAAGVPIAALERYLQRQYPQGLRPRVLRCMPNILVRYGNGVTGITRGNFATDEDISWTEWVMGHLGVTALVDEQLLDAVVAAAGSAPAFAFMFMEALTDAAVREGLPRHVARSFVAQTLSGAAQMAVRDAETHFGELRNRVESPGGTTIAGSCALEESGFRRAVLAAAAAAAARSRALSAYFI